MLVLPEFAVLHALQEFPNITLTIRPSIGASWHVVTTIIRLDGIEVA